MDSEQESWMVCPQSLYGPHGLIWTSWPLYNVNGQTHNTVVLTTLSFITLNVVFVKLLFLFQGQVEAGVPLHICLSRFSRWLQNLQLQMGVVFPSMQQQKCSTPSASQNLCAFLTWSGKMDKCLYPSVSLSLWVFSRHLHFN